jgi:hypothetical protein
LIEAGVTPRAVNRATLNNMSFFHCTTHVPGVYFGIFREHIPHRLDSERTQKRMTDLVASQMMTHVVIGGLETARRRSISSMNIIISRFLIVKSMSHAIQIIGIPSAVQRSLRISASLNSLSN